MNNQKKLVSENGNGKGHEESSSSKKLITEDIVTNGTGGAGEAASATQPEHSV